MAHFTLQLLQPTCMPKSLQYPCVLIYSVYGLVQMESNAQASGTTVTPKEVVGPVVIVQTLIKQSPSRKWIMAALKGARHL